MFRIDDPTAAGALPTPEAAGTPGYFTEGNPGGGVQATLVRASFLNMLQEELISLLTAAGISPSKTAYNQVLNAVKAIAAAQFTGSMVTPSSMKLPNGWIAQWGSTSNSASADVAVTFPVTFPNALFGIQITPQASGGGAFANHNTQTLSGFNFGTWTAAAVRATVTPNYWFAIGF